MQDSSNMFIFFKPSAELTEEIIKQNQAMVKKYAARTAPEEVAEFDGDEPNLARFGLGPQRTVRRTLRSPVETGQQVITERIYHYLSSLSESPWAMQGGSFAVSEYLPRGFITMLGFSSLRKQPHSQRAIIVDQLVDRLTAEFVDWLANQQNGAFVTPWLEIHLTTDGELRLIAIPETEAEDSPVEIADEAAVASASASATGAFTEMSNLPHLREIARELDEAIKALKILKELEETSPAGADDYDQSDARQATSFAENAR